jgi:hypothetical protein
MSSLFEKVEDLTWMRGENSKTQSHDERKLDDEK